MKGFGLFFIFYRLGNKKIQLPGQVWKQGKQKRKKEKRKEKSKETKKEKKKRKEKKRKETKNNDNTKKECKKGVFADSFLLIIPTQKNRQPGTFKTPPS